MFNPLDMENFTTHYAKLCVEAKEKGQPKPNVQVALQYWYRNNKDDETSIG